MTTRGVNAAIDQVARDQRGAFSRRQVYAAGGSYELVERRVRSGAWIPVSEQAMRLASHAESFEQRLWLAVADCEGAAVVTHEAAARLRRLATYGQCPEVVLTIPHGDKRTALARCHQTRRPLRGEELPWLPGLRVASTADAIVQLASVGVGRGRLKVVLEDAIIRRLVRLDRVGAAWFDAYGRRLKVEVLAEVIEQLSPGIDAATSELNRVLRVVLASLPGPAARFEAPFPGVELPGRLVDAVLLPERVIVEADGRRWHTRVADFDRDRQRDRAAARAGYQPVRFTYEEMTDDADGVVAELTELRVQRRIDLGLPPLSLAA